MLNDLIIKTNLLALELDKVETEEERRKVAEEFSDSLSRTLEFISANSVPVDTAITIEDRLVRQMLIKNREDEIRANAERNKAEYEAAKKETDYLTRGVNSGMGSAQLKYLEAKAKMDDFQSESAHMTKEERMNNIDTFNKLYSEYLAAKSEYERTGRSDAAALAESLRIATQRLKAAEAAYEESRIQLAKLPLKASDIDFRPGTGAVAKALTAAASFDDDEQILPTEPIDGGEEIKKLRDEARAELDALKADIARLKSEAETLAAYLDEAKAALATIEKARQAAVLSAKRVISLAEQTKQPAPKK